MSLVGQEAEHVCRWCACVFRAPLSRGWNGNFFCSTECKAMRRRETQNRTRAGRESAPERVAYNRTRNRLWRIANRGASGKASPWLLGAPAYGPLLPCVELDVVFSPAPKWPISLRSMRGIHGAITALLAETVGIRHREHTPTFSAGLDGPAAVRVIVWDERARSMDGVEYNGVLWDRPTKFSVRDIVDVSAPGRSLRRGRIPVRITTITPVTMSKDGHTRSETRPCKTSVERSLVGSLLDRVGLPGIGDTVRAEVKAVRTEPTYVNLGGKFGTIDGWSGEVDLEVNAPALWLLQSAEKIGLGSRVGFGFGRIQVEEIVE